MKQCPNCMSEMSWYVSEAECFGWNEAYRCETCGYDTEKAKNTAEENVMKLREEFLTTISLGHSILSLHDTIMWMKENGRSVMSVTMDMETLTDSINALQEKYEKQTGERYNRFYERLVPYRVNDRE